MEYNIKLNDNECQYILNALQHFKEKNLNQSLESLKKVKFQDMRGLFVNEEFFNMYIKEQIQIIKKQIQEIENLYEKITEEM